MLGYRFFSELGNHYGKWKKRVDIPRGRGLHVSVWVVVPILLVPGSFFRDRARYMFITDFFFDDVWNLMDVVTRTLLNKRWPKVIVLFNCRLMSVVMSS